MKELIISCILFALLLTGIALNAIFVKDVAKDLMQYGQKLEQSGEPDGLLSQLSSTWGSAQTILNLTVPRRELEQINEILLSLEVAHQHNDKTAFSRSCKLLVRAAEELERPERLDFIFFSYDAKIQPSTAV